MGDDLKNNNFKSNNILNKKDKYKDKYIIKLLIIYLINNDNKNANKLLEDIINKKCELNSNLSNLELVNLLYTSELFNLTEHVLQSYPEYNIYKKSEVEDLKIFNIYKDYMKGSFCNLNYVLKLIEINNFKLLDNNLRLKINRAFTKRLKELVIKKDEIKTIENFKKYTEYILIQNNKFSCSYCKSKLINTKVNLARYNGVTEDIKDYVCTKVYLCKECNIIYLTSAYINEINNLYGNSIIKRIKSYETEKTTIDSSNEMENINLRNKSILADYGYSTTLSKEARYKLLKNIIIPKIGYSRTISMLEHLIYYNGKSYKQKRALSEWEYDIKILKKEYKK